MRVVRAIVLSVALLITPVGSFSDSYGERCKPDVISTERRDFEQSRLFENLLSMGLNTANAQQRSDSAQNNGLNRIFRVRTREVVHPNIERLESALSDLASDPLVKEVASDEIELARRALDTAIAARRSGRLSDAERAEQLVEAAFLLASRKIARDRARMALRATKRRAVEAEKAVRRAERALEQAMQKRAALYLEQKK